MPNLRGANPVGRGGEVVGAAAMSDTEASRRGSAEERSARGGAMTNRGEPDGSQRTRKAGGGVLAGSGRSGRFRAV